jgi:hypothetical protein
MHFSLFHKMMIVLVVINAGGLLVWNEKFKNRKRAAKLEKESKRWLDLQIRTLYRIRITTEKEIIETDPILPTAKIDQLNLLLNKGTSLSNAEKYIDACMKRGYFKARMVSLPVKDINKVEIVPVAMTAPSLTRVDHQHAK